MFSMEIEYTILVRIEYIEPKSKMSVFERCSFKRASCNYYTFKRRRKKTQYSYEKQSVWEKAKTTTTPFWKLLIRYHIHTHRTFQQTQNLSNNLHRNMCCAIHWKHTRDNDATTNERTKKIPIPIYALKIINGAVLFCSNRAWIVCGASRSMESSAEQWETQ